MALFQTSEKTRRKLAAKAGKLLPEGTMVRDVLLGRAQARFTTPVIVVLAGYIVIMLVALALGVILIPGGILLVVLVQAILPQRLIVVADQGVAVVARGALSSRPSKIVAQVPLGAIAAPRDHKGRVQLGPDLITFSGRELARLNAVTTTALAPPAPPAPPAFR